MQRKLFACAAVFALMGLVSAGPKPPKKPGRDGDRLGLVDMAHVFKNSHEFLNRREALKKEITASDAKAKTMVTELKALQEDLKDAAAGSADQKDLQLQLVERKARYERFRNSEQQRFLKKEAKIYKEVYLKVQKLVSEIARKRGLTTVFRFSREGVETAKEPKEVLNKMNRLLIHYEKSQDITEAVLKELNARPEAAE